MSQIHLPPNSLATAILAPSRPSPSPPQSSSSKPAPTKIFLAGPISTPWRQNLATSLSHLPITFYDPLRPDWDSTWTEDPDICPKFREQTEWELEFREGSDLVVVMFEETTKTKGGRLGCEVTLLEFGVSVGEMAREGKGKTVVVCCPDGFGKRGNVKMVCERYGVEMVGTEGELRDAVERVVRGRMGEGDGVEEEGGKRNGEGTTVLRERGQEDGPVNPKKRMMNF